MIAFFTYSILINRFSCRYTFYASLLHKAVTVQECDARMLNSITIAGPKMTIILCLIAALSLRFWNH